MNDTRWIIVPNWDRFQHPDVARNAHGTPPWIRNYTALLSDDDYLSLTDTQRALLHGLWLMYALGRRCIRLDLQLINRKLGLSAKMATLQALNDAGFIHFSASKPLASRLQPASPEERREEDQGTNLSLDSSNLPVTETRAREQTEDEDEPGNGYGGEQLDGEELDRLAEIALLAETTLKDIPW